MGESIDRNNAATPKVDQRSNKTNSGSLKTAIEIEIDRIIGLPDQYKMIINLFSALCTLTRTHFSTLAPILEQFGFNQIDDLSNRELQNLTPPSPQIYRAFVAGSPFYNIDRNRISGRIVRDIFGKLSYLDTDELLRDFLRRSQERPPELMEDYIHDEATWLFKAQSGSNPNLYVAGPSIFWRSFSSLGLQARGVEPERLTIVDSGRRYVIRAPELLSSAWVENARLAKSFNGEKFSLTDIIPRADISDEGELYQLIIERSDWYTLRGSLESVMDTEDEFGRVLISRAEKRREYASIYPWETRVPASFCMVFVLRFADRKYVAVARQSYVHNERSRVSFSGEEQLRHEDFHYDGIAPSRAWAYRALLEEVYKCRNFRITDREAMDVIARIANVEYLGFVYEERTPNSLPVCIVEMHDTSAEFARHFVAQNPRYQGDFEGTMCIAEEDTIREVFQTGAFEIHPLVGDQNPIRVVAQAAGPHAELDGARILHSSSLVRMWLTGWRFGIFTTPVDPWDFAADRINEILRWLKNPNPTRRPKLLARRPENI